MIFLLLIALGLFSTASEAVPVVPNFQQGLMNSTTKTKTQVKEIINSYEYRTGYEYSVSGTNIQSINGKLAPKNLDITTNTINGISSRWVGLDASSRPTWNLVKKGASFQFVETLNGPGLVNHTLIERTTDIESLTETTSTFTQ